MASFDLTQAILPTERRATEPYQYVRKVEDFLQWSPNDSASPVGFSKVLGVLCIEQGRDRPRQVSGGRRRNFIDS